MDKGFIKLSRKFFSNDMWNEARTFSSCEAWLDLIQSARFEATPRKESIGGREVSYKRGQYPASIRYLSKRWKWTERKVRSFISYLKKEEMVTVESTQGISIITLCKYDEYNSSDTVNDTTNDTAIEKEIKELRSLVTQLTTQQMTQPPKKRHTGDTNSKKEKNNILPPNPLKGEGINKKARTLFEDYFNDTFSSSYYWTAKDAGNMKQLLQKITFSREQKKMPIDDDSMMYALKSLLSSINEGWIFENFSVANINSKYNEIVSQAKNGKTNRSTSPSKQEANEYAMQVLTERLKQREQGVSSEIPKPF